MASQGPLYPGTVTTQSVLPEDDNDWTTPGNIAADDGSEATITAATYDANDISFRLKAQNLGFTIPTDATITGIVVEIEKRDAAIGNAVDNRVQLLDAAAALVGDDKADTATGWPTNATIISYGGSADTWNASPTPAMVNDVDFGVVLSAKATAANTDIFVDFIRVTVHYTVPASLDAEPGSYVVTGVAATSLAARLVDAVAGAYALAGFDAGLSKGVPLNAEPGVYALAGADGGLLAVRLLNAEPGVYSVAGLAATVVVGRVLVGDSGVYVLTGIDATLQGPVGAFVLVADPGSYALTGTDAGALAARLLSGDPGAYGLTGEQASALAARLLSGEVGVYALTGAVADLVRGVTGGVLNAEPGVYIVTGAVAELFLPERIAHGPVSAITGDTRRRADVDDTKIQH